MHRTWLLLAIAFLTASAVADDPPAPRRVTLKFGWQEPEPFNPQRWLFSPEVVADKDGTVRLARSVLIAREMGATDHYQSEALSDQVWAQVYLGPLRKDELKLASKAEILVYGTPAQVEYAGKPLPGLRRLESTGWSRVDLPGTILKSTQDIVGWDSVVVKGGGSLLFEPTNGRPWSYKSTDGGRNWSRENLGRGGDTGGNYLIRLRLGLSAEDGWVESPVFDLWSVDPGDLPLVGEATQVRLQGSKVRRIAIRSGPTPDARYWGPWGEDLAVSRNRWVQFRFRWFGTIDEHLPNQFELAYSFRATGPAAKDASTVTRPADEKPRRRTSVPFIYEKPTPRLKHLREKYELDKVIAPGKSEMEQLMLLRHWVRNQWHTAWGNHPAAWMPPWDALQILGCKDQPDCLTMCTHYACVFTQCCLALGWNARHCILDHHCVAEVWVDQHQKWVMMDSGNSPTRPDCNLHFERNGVPLSALELHLAHRDKKTDGIMVCFTPEALMKAIAPLCRKPPVAHAPGSPRPEAVPLAELKNYPVCGLENYRRYAFPGRNNYLTSLYPGELYQGWAEYFYDGYWWVGDERDDPQLSPEYSKHLPPSRPQDIDWDLNWTRIHLARTARPDELQVDLETLTPSFERFEMNTLAPDHEKWQPAAASFAWKLRAGKNVLRVRSVNAWGRTGKAAEVAVNWQPVPR